jgi:hypothetical protein
MSASPVAPHAKSMTNAALFFAEAFLATSLAPKPHGEKDGKETPGECG